MFLPSRKPWPSERLSRRSRPKGPRIGSYPIAYSKATGPNTLLADRLTPEVLGKLVALYEHSVYTQGVLWDINPFDQWGVELGKALAQRIIPELESAVAPDLAYDSSTNVLIRRYREMRGRNE